MASTRHPPFWYGLANTLLSSLLLIITILIAIVIRRHDRYLKWTSYQIMFYISLCNIAQLTAQEFSGVSLMLEWEMPYFLNMILGSIISGTWISLSIYGILLAVHRLFILVIPLYEIRYFTGRSKTIIFAIAHSTIPIFTVFQWTKWTRIKFYREDFSWHYDKSLPLSHVSSWIDSYSIIPFIVCSLVCYSMIFYNLKTKGANKEIENVITINAFVYCLFCALIFILWRFVEPLFMTDQIVYFWTSLPLIIYNGVNGVISICFNRSMRANVLKLLSCRRNAEAQTSMKVFEKSQKT